MFFNGGHYYYLIVILEAFCVIHSYRNGTLNKWIFIVVFLPVIGSIIYIYSEILSNSRIRKPNIDMGAVFNPGSKITKLENELRFTDTFTNRVKLADAYLDAGQTDKAIQLYNASLTGAFAENEHVLAQLVIAYFEKEQYEEVIRIAKKIYKLPQFPRSKAHILYARALENSGNTDLAENEFKQMKGRYSYFGARYEYGLFLMRADRLADAKQIFDEMLNEEPHLGQVEKRTNRIWFAKAKEELRKMGA